MGTYAFYADIITIPTNAVEKKVTISRVRLEDKGDQATQQKEIGRSDQESSQLSQIIASGVDSGIINREPIAREKSIEQLPVTPITPATTQPSSMLAVSSPTDQSTTKQSVQTTSESPSSKNSLNNTLNILILGSDRRPEMTNWRTDVMMVVMLDTERQAAGVVSLPRDIYIDQIPNHYGNRINTIDYMGETDEPDGGGPKLLGHILEERIGIPIHHYLRFEFESFKDVVDALNGVEVEVDCAIADRMKEEEISIDLQPGLHRLNGAEALSYVRSRRIGGDLERARRQQRFVWAVRDQIINENWLPRVPALYEALSDSVQTDIGVIQTIQLVRFMLNLEPESVHGLVVSGTEMLEERWVAGMLVFIADWEKISEATADIFNRPSFMETNTVGEAGDKKRCY